MIQKRGFTLVEVLVATAIITVVMLVAIGAIITVQDANRKAQAIRAIIDNLHGAVENMSRKIRTGDAYHCGRLFNLEAPLAAQDCAESKGFDTSFAFYSSEDVVKTIKKKTEYRLECYPSNTQGEPLPDGTCPAGQKGRITYYREDSFDNAPLTDPKIDVKSLKFYVHNAQGAGANGQPSVLMTIKGEIEIERLKTKAPFNLQTTISQYLKN